MAGPRYGTERANRRDRGFSHPKRPSGKRETPVRVGALSARQKMCSRGKGGNARRDRGFSSQEDAIAEENPCPRPPTASLKEPRMYQERKGNGGVKIGEGGVDEGEGDNVERRTGVSRGKTGVVANAKPLSLRAFSSLWFRTDFLSGRELVPAQVGSVSIGFQGRHKARPLR